MDLSLENVVALGAAFGSPEIIRSVFGPSLDYFGSSMKEFVQKRVENTNKIIHKASIKLQKKEVDSNNGVNPLLVKSVIDFGSYTEDNLTQEYIAGLIVSSRIGLTNDNRPYIYSKLLESISVYQIRAHYIIYVIFSRLLKGKEINLNITINRQDLQTYIPFSQFYPYVLLTNEEKTLSSSLLDHTLYGLARNGLIENSLIMGSKEHICQTAQSEMVPEAGIVVQPSMLGIELFLAINSIGKDIQSKYFTNKDIIFEDLIDLTKLDTARCFIYPKI